jgi:hypothetical protein
MMDTTPVTYQDFEDWVKSLKAQADKEENRKKKEKSIKRMTFWGGVNDRLGNLIWNIGCSCWVFGLYGIMKDTNTPMPIWFMWSLFIIAFMFNWTISEIREVKSLLEKKEE